MDSNRALETFKKYETDETIQNFIQQANSRYILYKVNEPVENFPKYTQNLDERCISIAFTYLSVANSLYEARNDVYIEALEKAGKILEYLFNYEKCNNIYKVYGRIACALAYYASKQYSKSFIILNTIEEESYIANILKLLLTKNIDDLNILIEKILLDKNRINSVNDEEIYNYIFAKCIVKLLNYIYTGKKQKINEAQLIINDLIDLALSNEEPALWWVFKLFKIILNNFEVNSIWKILSKLNDEDSKKLIEKYILANLYKQPPVIEFFKSQIDCMDLVLNKKSGIIGIPTSSGKTKISEIAILKNFVENPESICVYIAPFKSLAYEVEDSLSEIFQSLGFKVSNLYGNSHCSQIDRFKIQESNIIIATPEKIKSIIRGVDDIKQKIKLVIVDEGHLIGCNLRYVYNELLIEELKNIIVLNNGRIFVLSAVLPNLSEFAKWISNDEANIATSKWRPSEQRFGVLELRGNNTNIIWKGKIPSYNKQFIEPIRLKKKKISFFPKNKKESVAAAAVKLSMFGSVLIYVGKSNMVLSQAREIKKYIELSNNYEYLNFEWINKHDYEIFTLSCKEYLGENNEILNLAQYGILCHSSRLPIEVRLSMDKLMKSGNPKIIVATSTLAQGVNIGVSSVIISNVWLNKSEKVKINDFWNIVGRAGRAFIDTEGKILYAIDRNRNNYKVRQDREDINRYFNYNLDEAESGLYYLLKEIFNISKECCIDFNQLIEMISEDKYDQFIKYKDKNLNEIERDYREYIKEIFDVIDDTLLSLNVDYESYKLENYSDWIDECFRKSLAFITAEKQSEFKGEELIKILKSRNNALIKMLPNYKEWKLYTNSSIPLRVNFNIDSKLDDIAMIIKKYISLEKNLENLSNFILELDDIICSFKTKNIYDYNCDKEYITLIRNMWFSGRNYDVIIELEKNAERICNEYYRLQFPWIVGAISKKLKKLEYTKEAEIIDEVAILAENGLPNIAAVKIYIEGIRSRVAATELSFMLIEKYTDLSINGNNILEKLISLTEKEHIIDNCTSITKSWLKEFKHARKNLITDKIKGFNLELNKDELKYLDKIVVKTIGNNYYFCSLDYEVLTEISPLENSVFYDILDKEGVYFEHIDKYVWSLKSDNPFIEII